MANILATLSASFLAVVLYALYQEFLSPAARKRKRLPPGPPGVPFLGNTDFPTVHAHKKFKEWADTYGEIYSLRLGSNNFVILNSDRVIKDLMDSVRHPHTRGSDKKTNELEREYLFFETVSVCR
jgi:hypothetical protein